jgi:AraC-like DNA-binding protein
MDRLSNLLQRFSVRAQMFHSGPLCGITDFPEHANAGQLHLLKQGSVEVQHQGAAPLLLAGRSAIFYPRPLAHRFITPFDGATEMVCANVLLGTGATNPLLQALPSIIVLPLAELEQANAVLAALFTEALASANCGRAHLIDRLFEATLVYLLRALMQEGRVAHGMLAGMADIKLARALVAIHEAPEKPWRLGDMASQAGMSRTQFALHFRDIVGITPLDYLTRFRVHLAQDLLLRGRPLKTITHEVGYSSSPALSRAFASVAGKNPRDWLHGCSKPMHQSL